MSSITVPLPSVPKVAKGRFAMGVAVFAATVGIILGVIAFIGLLGTHSTISTLRRQVRVLNTRMSAADRMLAQNASSLHTMASTANVSALQASVTTLQGSMTGMSRTVSGLKSQAAKVSICVPEMQQELGGLNVNTSTGSILMTDGTTDTFLTGAYITNPTVISTTCTSFLNGNAR